MSDVKRFEMYTYGCYAASEVGMSEEENGEYILYEDYAALKKKLDAVMVENALMIQDYRDTPALRRMGLPLTPATDAILNSVRADGVDVMRNVFISRVEAEYGPNDDVPGLIKAAQMCVTWAENIRSHSTKDEDK